MSDMGLKTTTWAGRNSNNIQTAVQIADSPTTKKVAVVGPGGIIPLPYLTQIPKNKAQKVIRFFMHQLESLFRKTGYFQLQQYEAQEIYETLQENDLQVENFAIFDLETAVLDAVQKSLGNKRNISYHLHDITFDRLPHQQYDLIFCYNVLQRTENPVIGLNNLINSLSDNGALSIISTNQIMELVRNHGLLVEKAPNLFTLKE